MATIAARMGCSSSAAGSTGDKVHWAGGCLTKSGLFRLFHHICINTLYTLYVHYMHMRIYTYIYIHYTHTYIYIYTVCISIYREREIGGL